MGFDEFWLKYPRKVAKMSAQKAYQQQIKKGNADAELLAGLNRFVDLLWSRGTDNAFIPHAASWLRAGRWQDDDGKAPGPADGIVPQYAELPTDGHGSVIARKLGAAQFRAYFSECEFVGSTVIAPTAARKDYILNKFQYRLPDLIVEVKS